MQANGMTLLEILITLFIVSILLLLSVPITSDFLHHNQLSTTTHTTLSIIDFSRNQALAVNNTLVLMPFDNADWSHGMRLFKDNNKTHQYDVGDEVIQLWQWPNSVVKITWQGFTSDHYLQFPADGINGALSGTFTLCSFDSNDHQGISIIINRLGRARVQDITNC